MPNPTPGDVHVNRPLTAIMIAYMQDLSGFVADQVFPNVPVAKQSDRYFQYDRSDWFRNTFKRRAPGTESAGGGMKIDNTPTYYADVWALHKDIDDQTRGNADEPIDMDRDATEWLALQAALNREVNWASKYFATGIWSTEVSGDAASPAAGNVLQWNEASSDPIGDVKAKATVIQNLTAYRPNTLTVGRQVWDALSTHPDLLDRIKYGGNNTTPALVTRQAAAALFEIARLFVMDGVQTTSNENPAFETSMTNAFIGGKHALLTYSPPRASLMMPSAGYTFSWSAFAGAGNQGQRIKRFRKEDIESDRIEAQMAYDQKVVGADLGAFFESIVA